LRGEGCGGEKGGSHEQSQGSHRLALIHRGGGGVKRWSYQFAERGRNFCKLWRVEFQDNHY
jgi:hypothetical protein